MADDGNIRWMFSQLFASLDKQDFPAVAIKFEVLAVRLQSDSRYADALQHVRSGYQALKAGGGPDWEVVCIESLTAYDRLGSPVVPPQDPAIRPGSTWIVEKELLAGALDPARMHVFATSIREGSEIVILDNENLPPYPVSPPPDRVRFAFEAGQFWTFESTFRRSCRSIEPMQEWVAAKERPGD